MPLTDDRKQELATHAIDAAETLVDSGRLDEDDAVDLVADLLDWLVDLPDGVWRWLIETGLAIVRPKPWRLRKRADRAQERGNVARAARLRERADRLES